MASRNAPVTRREFSAIRQLQAASILRTASEAAVGGAGIEQLQLAIDGGVTAYPLTTTDQTLAGAINELQGEINALGSGGGGGTGIGFFDFGDAAGVPALALNFGGAA